MKNSGIIILIILVVIAVLFQLNNQQLSHNQVRNRLVMPPVAMKEEFLHVYEYPDDEITFSKGKDTGRTSVTVDLDGDGKVEQVSVKMKDDNLHVYLDVHVGNALLSLVDINAQSFAIMDLDKSDNQKEVMLFDQGPSNDENGYFLGFRQGVIYQIGNPGRWPAIQSNGKVSTCIFQGFWCITKEYNYDSKNMKLVALPRENSYEVNVETEARKTIELYTDTSGTQIATRVLPGQKIKVLSATDCAHSEWGACSWFAVQSGSRVGWVKNDMEFISKTYISPAD